MCCLRGETRKSIPPVGTSTQPGGLLKSDNAESGYLVPRVLSCYGGTVDRVHRRMGDAHKPFSLFPTREMGTGHGEIMDRVWPRDRGTLDIL